MNNLKAKLLYVTRKHRKFLVSERDFRNYYILSQHEVRKVMRNIRYRHIKHDYKILRFCSSYRWVKWR